MSNCNFTTQISENLCIGDSLPILNFNFDSLDTTLCNLSSILNSSNIDLNYNTSIFSSNIFNLVNLLNIVTTTGIQSITPGYLVVQSTTYQAAETSGSFTLPNNIPNTATCVLIRADYTSPYYTMAVYVNGIAVPISTYEIDGIGTYAYLTLPLSNLYTYTINVISAPSRGIPIYNTTTNIRIIGYY